MLDDTSNDIINKLHEDIQILKHARFDMVLAKKNIYDNNYKIIEKTSYKEESKLKNNVKQIVKEYLKKNIMIEKSVRDYAKELKQNSVNFMVLKNIMKSKYDQREKRSAILIQNHAKGKQPDSTTPVLEFVEYVDILEKEQEPKPIYIYQDTIQKMNELFGQFYGTMIINAILKKTVIYRHINPTSTPYNDNEEIMNPDAFAKQIIEKLVNDQFVVGMKNDIKSIYKCYILNSYQSKNVFTLTMQKSDEKKNVNIYVDDVDVVSGGNALKLHDKPHKNSFESKTVNKLKSYAINRKIKGYSTMYKSELVQALRKHRKTGL
jgi:hypothetical protein